MLGLAQASLRVVPQPNLHIHANFLEPQNIEQKIMNIEVNCNEQPFLIRNSLFDIRYSKSIIVFLKQTLLSLNPLILQQF